MKIPNHVKDKKNSKENLKIGNLKLKSKFLLAPMLEPNDIAFRLLCKKYGAALTYTGMTSPLSKKKIHFDDLPAVQLFGNNSKGIYDFIKGNEKNVSLFDFNLGCPSKLSKQLAHGSFMHDNISGIESVLKEMRRATKKPITIKLRKSKQCLEICKMAQKYVDAIAIHPRTGEQGYSGKTDYKFALMLKNELKIPVIYSGDVGPQNIEKISKDFDFVFIARLAIGDPKVFDKINKKDFKKDSSEDKIKILKEYLKLAEKYEIHFRQIKYQVMNFTKGLPGSRRLREKLIHVKNIKEVEEVIKTNK